MTRLSGKKLGMVASLVAAVSLGVVGLAMAAPGNGNGGKAPEERKAEWAARKAEVLKKYDANGDGKLDAQEKKNMVDDRAAERFKKLDTDGNGAISLAEFQQGMEQRAENMKGHRHGHHGHGHGPGAAGPNGEK